MAEYLRTRVRFPPPPPNEQTSPIRVRSCRLRGWVAQSTFSTGPWRLEVIELQQSQVKPIHQAGTIHIHLSVCSEECLFESAKIKTIDYAIVVEVSITDISMAVAIGVKLIHVSYIGAVISDVGIAVTIIINDDIASHDGEIIE